MNIQTDKIISLLRNNIYLLLFAVGICIIPLGVYIYTSFKKEGEGVTSEIKSDKNTVEENETFSEQIYVEAAGAVKSPGVYQISKDNRVNDLIKLAGGFADSASVEWISKKLNLSSKLVDTQKIYIPFIWDTISTSTDVLAFDIPDPMGVHKELINTENGVEDQSQGTEGLLDDGASAGVTNQSTTTTSSDNLLRNSNTTNNEGINNGQESLSNIINVNSASKEDLDSLPGIGLTYAEKIIVNRPYKSVDELKQKTGIPQSTILKFISRIRF